MKLNKTEIEVFLNQGFTYSAIAKELGVSRQAVSEFVKRHKIPGKVWKGKQAMPKNKLALRKKAFPLGPEIYALAAEKYRRKKTNMRGNFHVKMEDIPWVTHCPILGIELDYFSSLGCRAENSVSFDRINPNKGYVPGNVLVVSWRACRIKSDGTGEEHRKIANYLDKLNNSTT